jgi:hypothetical protein
MTTQSSLDLPQQLDASDNETPRILLAGVDPEREAYINAITDPLSQMLKAEITAQTCAIEELEKMAAEYRNQLLGVIVFMEKLRSADGKDMAPEAYKAQAAFHATKLPTAIVHNEQAHPTPALQPDTRLDEIMAHLSKTGIHTHSALRDPFGNIDEVSQFCLDWKPALS